jgi:branched-chain amino acid transport system ATP-binding protein
MLEVNNIDVVYGRVIQVLRGVSLEVEDGRIVALLGANGAGKTTTLKAISGMLRTEEGEVTEGSIVLAGTRIDTRGPEDIAAMGLSQAMEGRRVLEHLTVEENLLVGAYCRKDKGVKSDVEMVLDYMPKIKRLRKRVSGYLSGGEQQMLVIGRALMARPRLMLLDEPSLGLAPLMVADVYEIIARINAEQGTSILLVEQNAQAALGIAHYGYVMENGKVVLGAPSDDLKNNREVRESYLGLSGNARKSYHDIKHYRRKKRWA